MADNSTDTGHLHVTYYGNWFDNINSRTPEYRFGEGHVFKYVLSTTTFSIHEYSRALLDFIFSPIQDLRENILTSSKLILHQHG